MLSASITTQLREFKLDVELDVPAGTCLAIVGPSGAGKSTVLRAIAGLHRPAQGRITLENQVWLDLADGVDLPPERRSCGYLFQDYALFPHLNAWRNVAFGLNSVPRAERRPHAEKLLEGFGAAALADASPRELSGGERQRVALARALAPQPAVILLDEPLAALDARTSASAARELADALARTSAPAILVTHDFAEAALLADEIAVVDRGSIVQRGTAATLSARPQSTFVADFTGAVVMFGTARRAESDLTLVELDGGGSITSTDRADGPVGVAIYPWEITIEAAGTPAHGSALNRLEARVVSVTEIGSRLRVGLLASQPLVAEITRPSADRLGVAPGAGVVATWKATSTRLIER